MSKKSYAAFLKAISDCGHVYTLNDCGCLALVMYDEPSVIRDAKREIAEQIAMGREVHRCARGDLPPFECAAHKRVIGLPA